MKTIRKFVTSAITMLVYSEQQPSGQHIGQETMSSAYILVCICLNVSTLMITFKKTFKEIVFLIYIETDAATFRTHSTLWKQYQEVTPTLSSWDFYPKSGVQTTQHIFEQCHGNTGKKQKNR